MYASVRAYRVNPSRLKEFDDIVQSEFVPLYSGAHGFVAYYAIDAGDGRWVSVGLFDTEDAAKAANALTAQFVGQRLLPMIQKGPEITTGRVVATARATG